VEDNADFSNFIVRGYEKFHIHYEGAGRGYGGEGRNCQNLNVVIVLLDL